MRSEQEGRVSDRVSTRKAADDNLYVVNFEERKSDLSINEYEEWKVFPNGAACLLYSLVLLLLPITAMHLQGRNGVENRNGA